MIIGNGLLAQAFTPEFSNNQDVIIFASGVSNSKENRPEVFARERDMLQNAMASGQPLAYFSTCSLLDPEMAGTPYVLHKRAIEQLLAERHEAAAVFRLPQVVGRTPNPYTLTNYLYRQIETGTPFQVWLNARRNLIDVSDVANIVRLLLPQALTERSAINVACPFSIPVIELVATFETVLGKKANYQTANAGSGYPIDVKGTLDAAKEAGIAFDANYVDQLIRKYYAH